MSGIKIANENTTNGASGEPSNNFHLPLICTPHFSNTVDNSGWYERLIQQPRTVPKHLPIHFRLAISWRCKP